MPVAINPLTDPTTNTPECNFLNAKIVHDNPNPTQISLYYSSIYPGANHFFFTYEINASVGASVKLERATEPFLKGAGVGNIVKAYVRHSGDASAFDQNTKAIDVPCKYSDGQSYVNDDSGNPLTVDFISVAALPGNAKAESPGKILFTLPNINDQVILTINFGINCGGLKQCVKKFIIKNIKPATKDLSSDFTSGTSVIKIGHCGTFIVG